MISFQTLGWIQRTAGCLFIVALAFAGPTIAEIADSANVDPSETEIRSFNGTWEVSIDGGDSWQPAQVPGTIEDQIQVDFDGTSLYRLSFTWDAASPKDKRLLLRFDAVATHAQVTLNGQRLGEHLGGWTPFEFDVTEILRSGENRIEVICDERVGHNTQGFLPVFAPHFGGVWKPVRLLAVDDVSIVTGRVGVHGNLETGELELEIPIRANSLDAAQAVDQVSLAIRPFGQEQWRSLPTIRIPTPNEQVTPVNSSDVAGRWQDQMIVASVPLKTPDGHSIAESVQRWSPESPNLYELQIRLNNPQQSSSQVRFGFRSFEASGHSFKLNGTARSIRGVLNWGYAPPAPARPWTSPS